MSDKRKKVGIIMGSINDYDKVKPAIDFFKELNIEYEAHVYSAHRTPAEVDLFMNKASEDFAVILAPAGKAAHLAGTVAAKTVLPVIGIPIKSSTLDGLDALLSTVQMPQGVPVATVAIDGAHNAAVLAAQILAVFDDRVREELLKNKERMRENVLDADKKLQALLEEKGGRFEF